MSNPKYEYLKRNKKLKRWFALETYQDFLASEYWKLLKEYGYAQPESGWCFICRSEKNIVLHHVKYSKIYVPSLKYILPVCRDCHELIHDVNFNEENGFDVLKSTQAVAEAVYMDKKTVKKLGIKSFYRKFWSCGLQELKSPEMKAVLEKRKSDRRKKK